MTPWWVAIVTFVGGSGVTLGLEWIRTLKARADRTQEAIERKEDRRAESTARSEERQAELSREHHGRQVATLEDLQSCLSDYMRSCGEIEAFDRREWRIAGSPADRYPVSLLPEGVSERNNGLQRQVQVLAERIDDSEVRLSVRELISIATRGLTNDSHERATRRMTDATLLFRDLNERIGWVIRDESTVQWAIAFPPTAAASLPHLSE